MTHNVYPLLALYDRVAVYHQQSRSYETKPINRVDKGHYSAFADATAIRKHFLQVLEKVIHS